jgi:hypothetical protein
MKARSLKTTQMSSALSAKFGAATGKAELGFPTHGDAFVPKAGVEQ